MLDGRLCELDAGMAQVAMLYPQVSLLMSGRSDGARVRINRRGVSRFHRAHQLADPSLVRKLRKS
jgi:hypothetical protein